MADGRDAVWAPRWVVNSIGEYRSVMLGSRSHQLERCEFHGQRNIDFLGNFGRMFSGERGNAEVTNAGDEHRGH